MSDIKEKLRQLRKERSVRSRSRHIQETWEQIEKDETLSTKEKLEQLINLTRKENKPRPQAPDFEPLSREPLQVFENSYSLDKKYGKILLSLGKKVEGMVLSCLSRDPAFENLDLSTALFIDLETTGLSGGTGVVPFLVGLGYYRDNDFHVIQFFLGELAEEERMIQEISHYIMKKLTVVVIIQEWGSCIRKIRLSDYLLKAMEFGNGMAVIMKK